MGTHSIKFYWIRTAISDFFQCLHLSLSQQKRETIIYKQNGANTFLHKRGRAKMSNCVYNRWVWNHYQYSVCVFCYEIVFNFREFDLNHQIHAHSIQTVHKPQGKWTEKSYYNWYLHNQFVIHLNLSHFICLFHGKYFFFQYSNFILTPLHLTKYLQFNCGELKSIFISHPLLWNMQLK